MLNEILAKVSPLKDKNDTKINEINYTSPKQKRVEQDTMPSVKSSRGNKPINERRRNTIASNLISPNRSQQKEPKLAKNVPKNDQSDQKSTNTGANKQNLFNIFHEMNANNNKIGGKK